MTNVNMRLLEAVSGVFTGATLRQLKEVAVAVLGELDTCSEEIPYLYRHDVERATMEEIFIDAVRAIKDGYQ